MFFSEVIQIDKKEHKLDQRRNSGSMLRVFTFNNIQCLLPCNNFSGNNNKITHVYTTGDSH